MAGGWFLPVWNISEQCGIFLQEKQNRTKSLAAEYCLHLHFSVWSTILTTADVTAATVSVSMAVNITVNIVKNLIQRERLEKGCNTSAEFPLGTFDGFACLVLLVFLRKKEVIWCFGCCKATSFRISVCYDKKKKRKNWKMFIKWLFISSKSFLGHHMYGETRNYCYPNQKENIHIEIPQTGIFSELLSSGFSTQVTKYNSTRNNTFKTIS